MGTNSIDNAARVCHSPSTVGLKEALGVAATTCSYSDWIGTDLVVFIGSNLANNQPVTTKYLYHAKKAGTKVAVVNPYREPGMERYWVPSNLESAVFGTKIADRFFLINVGGDIAFLNGALKHMIERGWLDHGFIDDHTDRASTSSRGRSTTSRGRSWRRLAGAPGDEMPEFAAMLGEARTAVFVWSMGVTQHEFGEDNVRAIVNLGLTKGFVGREKCGLMPIRGHSGVQGGAEMGAYSTALPGGLPIDEETRPRFSALGVRGAGDHRPDRAGDDRRRPRGRARRALSLGRQLPRGPARPGLRRRALARIPLRVHRTSCSPARCWSIRPRRWCCCPRRPATRSPGGVTQTSTERRIIFSPEIPGPRIGEARPEWEVFLELAPRVRPSWPSGSTSPAPPRSARRSPGSSRSTTASSTCAKSATSSSTAARTCAPAGSSRPRTARRTSPWCRCRSELPEGTFAVATRRGKQFNSMVHEQDALTGAVREAVLISRDDAERLGLADGDAVMLSSHSGEYRGRVRIAPIAPGNLQVHWPEGRRERASPTSTPSAPWRRRNAPSRRQHRAAEGAVVLRAPAARSA